MGLGQGTDWSQSPSFLFYSHSLQQRLSYTEPALYLIFEKESWRNITEPLGEYCTEKENSGRLSFWKINLAAVFLTDFILTARASLRYFSPACSQCTLPSNQDDADL